MFSNKFCCICLDGGFKASEMFSIALCGHQFCLGCMKKHIEVRLSEGSIVRCPQFKCKFLLKFKSCAYLLTPKLRAIWEQRIKEESIPIKERIYCPNRRCSALMSITELPRSNNGVKSCCVKCDKPFCINCKVPWHNKLSCNDFKRLNLNPTANLIANDVMFNALAKQKGWRQCGKCQHMIERSSGCIHLVCRCGYSFCYMCGAKWGCCRCFAEIWAIPLVVLLLLPFLIIIYCVSHWFY